MVMTAEIQDLIRARAGYLEIREAAVRAGMMTMQQDAARKILEGITSLEEVEKRIFVEDEKTSV